MDAIIQPFITAFYWIGSHPDAHFPFMGFCWAITLFLPLTGVFRTDIPTFLNYAYFLVLSGVLLLVVLPDITNIYTLTIKQQVYLILAIVGIAYIRWRYIKYNFRKPKKEAGESYG